MKETDKRYEANRQVKLKIARALTKLVAAGILSVSNRLHISYPHSGEQSPAYCQTLERQALSAKEKCSARKTAL